MDLGVEGTPPSQGQWYADEMSESRGLDLEIFGFSSLAVFGRLSVNWKVQAKKVRGSVRGVRRLTGIA